MSARFATPKEIGEIMRLLFQHCKSVDGRAVYDDGWDDATIAKAIHPNLGHHHVRRFRRENFGECRTGNKDGVNQHSLADLQKRVEDLELRVSLIEPLVQVNRRY